MEEKRDTENLIASDTAAAPITPMEEVDVPAAATPLGRSRVRSLARSAGALLAFAMVGPSRCTGRRASSSRRTTAAWEA